MKVVIDTNVFISATFWHGDPERIITKAENNEIELVLSKEIIEEFIKVLHYKEITEKIKDKDLEMKYTIKKIISISEIVEPSKKLEVVKDDPDDNKFIEAAVEGKCAYIISSDKHLLKIGDYEGIIILSPKKFIELFLK